MAYQPERLGRYDREVKAAECSASHSQVDCSSYTRIEQKYIQSGNPGIYRCGTDALAVISIRLLRWMDFCSFFWSEQEMADKELGVKEDQPLRYGCFSVMASHPPVLCPSVYANSLGRSKYPASSLARECLSSRYGCQNALAFPAKELDGLLPLATPL